MSIPQTSWTIIILLNMFTMVIHSYESDPGDMEKEMTALLFRHVQSNTASIQRLNDNMNELNESVTERNDNQVNIMNSSLETLRILSRNVNEGLKDNSDFLSSLRIQFDTLASKWLNESDNATCANKESFETLLKDIPEEIFNISSQFFRKFRNDLRDLKSSFTEAQTNSTEASKLNFDSLQSLDTSFEEVANENKVSFNNISQEIKNLENKMNDMEKKLKQNIEAKLESFGQEITAHLSNNSQSISQLRGDLNALQGDVLNIKDINITLQYVNDNVNDILIKVASLSNKTQEVQARDCADLRKAGRLESGVYTIWPYGSRDKFQVYCDMKFQGGGWTVIQRRGAWGWPRDYFYKTWNQYRSGFGELKQEFWLGNDHISALTKQFAYQLLVDLWDREGEAKFAKYDTFVVENESQLYELQIGGYSGNAGDSMAHHNKARFSTKDRDNDNAPEKNCAESFKGGWWFNMCMASNLNGLNLQGPVEEEGQGISWRHWKGTRYSLATSIMKIRPLNF